MIGSQNSPYRLLEPADSAIPLVCDSPHSGTEYPADFCHVVPRAQLRGGEDTHVDQLWRAAPSVGATLLLANFPRTYIDLNRTANDIDPLLLDGDWPEPLSPSEKSRLGYGLIWRKLNAATVIYDRQLSVNEVQQRIQNYYRPYHFALAQAIENSIQRFGGVWHLNLHSMPNNAYERLQIKNNPHPLADFVLGDRDGTTCEPEFMNLIEQYLRTLGYTVARNDPYKGMQLIAQIGQPNKNRHSLQVEIRRPIYMNEASREPNANFQTVQNDITQLLKKIAEYLSERSSPTLQQTHQVKNE
ncbi:N-formylglutamate amidohydrolase [Polynucleobacter sp. IMCC30063]|uniref:N-formylglutamate amidohydrolase n=1 Tax=Polynucleobacter sp. IMCC30063 TaxID=2907298 RepID=UPI001F1820D0|nr:N-formylglutamate amidohydrolase [Polynucleobacter sp. IMCC30063]MCE7505694.1 N-formylglutamate amidohydrolase [Polynucleobacter sp. IMCC30063]